MWQLCKMTSLVDTDLEYKEIYISLGNSTE